MQTLILYRNKPVVQVPALLLTLGLMWLLPVLVHLIPYGGSVPLGARLLAIFYAPLLAVWLFHPAIGLVAGLTMPFVNYALTGMPAPGMTALLSLELCVFVLVLLVLHRRAPRFLLTAPLAVLAAKAVSSLVLVVLPLVPSAPLAYFQTSILDALPGLLVLLALDLGPRLLWHER